MNPINSMYTGDTINGVIFIVCFAAVYFHWIVYELKEHLLKELPAVESEMAEAEEIIAKAQNWRRPQALLNEARRLLQQASQGKQKSKLGEILDARQRLYASKQLLQRAIKLAEKTRLRSVNQ